jgi:hypothetical protein
MMKNFCKFVGLVSALALGTTIASAANADSIHVNIPFSFVVSGKVFPAGHYTVQQTDSGVVLVHGNNTSAIALSIPVAPSKSGTVPALRFIASNGQEHLVSIEGDTMTRALSSVPVETRSLTVK